jgi:hypothetical protein
VGFDRRLRLWLQFGEPLRVVLQAAPHLKTESVLDVRQRLVALMYGRPSWSMTEPMF